MAHASDTELSVGDFNAIELLRIVDTFAEGFDDLPELVPGRPDYRVLVTAGLLVRGLNVVGQILAGGAVELLSLDVDLERD